MPDKLILDLATNFSAGELEKVADAFHVPSDVIVEDKVLRISSRQVIVDALATYRANLRVEGYENTVMHIDHREEGADGRVRYLVRWENFNDAGAVISSANASYFLNQGDDGRWLIVQHEILPSGNRRMREGIGLV